MSLRLAILFLALVICVVAAGHLLAPPSRIHLTLAAGTVKASPSPAAGEVQHVQSWFSDAFGKPEPERKRSWSREPSWLEPEGAPSWSEREEPPRRKQRALHSRYPSHSAYRTLCVRLCDGYYWPISYATSRKRFSRDAQACEMACPGKSRLFVHRTGSDDIDDELSDLEGRSYAELENAFRFRREYVADCACRGNPWDEEGLARHRAYVEAAKTAKTKRASASATISPTSKSGEARN